MRPLEAGPAAEQAAFSVVLPAFDEERGLHATLEELRVALAGVGRTFEIVVVDDGSTDATPDVLASHEGVRVVRHATTRGYGAALKSGIRAAAHPLVVVMDADGTYPASAIPVLVDACRTAHMVVGARRGAMHSGIARGAVKWCFRQFAQWITGAAIPDLNSGLRAFQRGVAERFAAVLPDGFSFTTTITVSSLLEGLTVRFEPVDYRPRIGRSKIRPVRDTLRIGRQLARLGVVLSPFRTSVAAALVLAAAFAATSTWELFEQGRIPAFAFAWLVASTAALAAGLAAELRVRRRRPVTAELATPRGS
jgi:glycosyltransferase involved in cell wall biosynthesis